MDIIKKVAYVLVIIGGLNWGLYGISGLDLVQILAGEIPMIADIIYVLVGFSALFLVLMRKKCSCSNNECVCDIDVHTNPETK